MRTPTLFTAAAVLGALAWGARGECAPASASAAIRDTIGCTPSLSLADLTRAAGTVVVGRVTQVRVARHPRYRRLTVTHVTVSVADAWKGSAGRSMTFTQFGDASGHGPRPGSHQMELIPGMPTYREGEDLLLFLRPPSRAALTSPVGGATGKLAVRREPGTGKAQVRGAVAETPTIASAARLRDEWVALHALRARVLDAMRREGRQR